MAKKGTAGKTPTKSTTDPRGGRTAGGAAPPVSAVRGHGHGQKPSSLLDTRVIYCGDCLEQLKNLPDGCVDLIYIDPPFNSNRNY